MGYQFEAFCICCVVIFLGISFHLGTVIILGLMGCGAFYLDAIKEEMITLVSSL